MQGQVTTLHFSASGASPPEDGRGARAHIPAKALEMPVLVVEDEVMIAWMMESLLEEMGFTDVVLAADGKDAVEAAARLHPGLILSDINLGPTGMDGVEAMEAISRSERSTIVFITGYAGDDARDRIARRVPGASLLRKPIVPEMLRHAIIDALKAQESH